MVYIKKYYEPQNMIYTSVEQKSYLKICYSYYFLKEKQWQKYQRETSIDRQNGQTQQILMTLIHLSIVQFSSVQSLSHVQLFATPWIPARQASLSITNSRSSLKLTSIESVMPSSHLHPLSSHSPAPNPSQHQSLFQWVNSSHEVAMKSPWEVAMRSQYFSKYRSFSFSIILSKDIPGLISFRMDWLDLLAVQGTLKSLLQHHSSKASILWHSAFFTV